MVVVGRNILELVPYFPGKPIEEVQRELGIEDPVKLASNENPLGPSPAAVAALATASKSLHRYPDAAARRLKDRLARLHGVSTAEIILGSGSHEIIELAVRTFIGAGEEGVLSAQTFVAYERALQATGAVIRTVPLVGVRQDLPGLARATGPKAKVLFLANPNNPTGEGIGLSDIARLLSALPPTVVPVFDEAYADYARAPAFGSALELRDRHPNVLVLRTFSKIHGLAGLRVGYGIGPVPVIELLERVRMPFNVSSAAQAAALASLEDEAHVASSRALVREQEPRVRRALEELGLDVAPSEANFLLVDIRRDAALAFEALLRHGVIVRPMGPYGFPMHLRVTIGLPGENDRFLAALREVLV